MNTYESGITILSLVVMVYVWLSEKKNPHGSESYDIDHKRTSRIFFIAIFFYFNAFILWVGLGIRWDGDMQKRFSLEYWYLPIDFIMLGTYYFIKKSQSDSYLNQVREELGELGPVLDELGIKSGVMEKEFLTGKGVEKTLDKARKKNEKVGAKLKSHQMKRHKDEKDIEQINSMTARTERSIEEIERDNFNLQEKLRSNEKEFSKLSSEFQTLLNVQADVKKKESEISQKITQHSLDLQEFSNEVKAEYKEIYAKFESENSANRNLEKTVKILVEKTPAMKAQIKWLSNNMPKLENEIAPGELLEIEKELAETKKKLLEERKECPKCRQKKMVCECGESIGGQLFT